MFGLFKESPAKLKTQSEGRLKNLGIVLNPNLPYSFESLKIEIKKPSEIANRIIILWEIVNNANKAIEAKKEESIEFLKDISLWEYTSENEKKFLTSKINPEQDIIDATWKTEALKVLYWSLNEIENLGSPSEDLNLVSISNKVSEKYENDIDTFIHKTKLRSKIEILKETDFIYRLHWASRKHRRNNTNVPKKFQYSVIYEKHYALNWITNKDTNWGKITCDT